MFYVKTDNLNNYIERYFRLYLPTKQIVHP